MEPHTQTTTEATDEAGPPAPPAPLRDGWIGWSYLTGLLLAVPLGWMLAFLAALPFMLGLFFFLLLGLVIAATMFRFGIKAPPPSRAAAWFMGTSVAVLIMGTSLWTEYRAFPRSVERVVRNSYFESFTPDRREQLRAGVHSHAAEFLAREYPPGGLPGYLRWAATNGRMTCPRILKESTVPYRLPYRRGMWIVRVVLSLLLVEWTIMSQMLALRIERAPRAASGPTTGDAPQVS